MDITFLPLVISTEAKRNGEISYNKGEISNNMEKKKIVYIHGFGGSPFTQTVGFLNLYYPDYEWCALEVDHHAGASIKKINDFAKENEVFAMMGTSLGGFYVLCS